MRSSASSFFFLSLIILRLSGILLLFVPLRKSRRPKILFLFPPLGQFRVFVFFLSLLGRTTDRREGEDAKKDGTLPLSLVFDENNNMEEVFVVVVVVVVVSSRERDLRLFARARS